MNRSTINFIIDVLLAILMMAVTGIGFMMRYVLIPGRDRWAVYGRNVDLSILGMDRHEWGTVHLAVGCALLALLILHIVYHWGTIVVIHRRLVPHRALRVASAIILFLLCAALVGFPFLINPVVQDSTHGEHAVALPPR